VEGIRNEEQHYYFTEFGAKVPVQLGQDGHTQFGSGKKLIAI
jgi:hypothetical protein